MDEMLPEEIRKAFANRRPRAAMGTVANMPPMPVATINEVVAVSRLATRSRWS